METGGHAEAGLTHEMKGEWDRRDRRSGPGHMAKDRSWISQPFGYDSQPETLSLVKSRNISVRYHVTQTPRHSVIPDRRVSVFSAAEDHVPPCSPMFQGSTL